MTNIKETIVDCIWIGKQKVISLSKFRKNQKETIESPQRETP